MGVISSLGDAPGTPIIDAMTGSGCGVCASTCPLEVLTKTEEGISVNNTNGCIARPSGGRFSR